MKNRWLRQLTMLLPGRIYFALGPWHFGDFCNIFLPNIGEDQKKSYDFSLGAPSWCSGAQPEIRNGGLFWGLGAEPPALENFAFVLQNELNFRAILIENNAFKTWLRNCQPNMIQLIALMGYMGSG